MHRHFPTTQDTMPHGCMGSQTDLCQTQKTRFGLAAAACNGSVDHCCDRGGIGVGGTPGVRNGVGVDVGDGERPGCCGGTARGGLLARGCRVASSSTCRAAPIRGVLV